MSGSLLTSVPDLSNYLGCKSKLKVIINRREIGHINGGDIRNNLLYAREESQYMMCRLGLNTLV